jgi:ABC-type nickel/cobalt efflux system permease component RcnA
VEVMMVVILMMMPMVSSSTGGRSETPERLNGYQETAIQGQSSTRYSVKRHTHDIMICCSRSHLNKCQLAEKHVSQQLKFPFGQTASPAAAFGSNRDTCANSFI